MEEIRQIALAYYANFAPNQKNAIIKLFREMDGDGNGRITFTEYVAFFNLEGMGETLAGARMFKEFDRDDNGTLDFEEFICFFYAHAIRRLVFCEGCFEYLKGAYFTCMQCFQQNQRYDLCCTCYRTANFKHHSDADFYDNYTLLRIASSPPEPVASSSKGQKAAKVAVHVMDGVDTVFKGVELASGLASVGCSIM